MFKHRLSLNPFFAGQILILILFYKEINWGLFYLSYFLIYGIGVGLGFHRIICHDIQVQPWLAKISILLGVLSHTGSLKGSILWHTNHHIHADTDKDTKKTIITALKPRVENLNISLSLLRRSLNRIDRSPFLSFIDEKYYIVFSFLYAVVFAIFGLKMTFFYVLAPSALALITHSYGAILVHRFGYKNFDLKDNSRNNFCLLPILFGENWHNNHHNNTQQLNHQVRWWEVDIIYQITKYFYVR